MSGSRSPSPHLGGGWSSPGLMPGSGSSTPHSHVFSPQLPGHGGGGILSWSAAKAKSDRARSYPSFSTKNSGFFSRQKRMISSSLPRFHAWGYVDKDDRNGYTTGRDGCLPRIPTFFGSMFRRNRSRLLLVIGIFLIGYIFFRDNILAAYRRSAWGEGRKFVIILGSNVEGGVMEWKGAADWAIERNSVWDKEQYAKRWGYELEVVNMLAQKRYSHEWREGWEKVDAIRDAMLKYPHAEWFWWLDLNTWIMEHSYSLQDHIFNDLSSHVYRDINEYNPLNISHPPTAVYLDTVSRSVDGDGDPSSIHIILSQDCGGFNLGSFFARRSIWTDRLLDVWWDPVMYVQEHASWEHNEQDSLEYLYAHQPWMRSGVAFLPQRHINAFPPGACGDEVDPKIHYSPRSRDFLVNMAGCKFGRDCWGEVVRYRELSKRLQRSWWQRVRDAFRAARSNFSGEELDIG